VVKTTDTGGITLYGNNSAASEAQDCPSAYLDFASFNSSIPSGWALNETTAGIGRYIPSGAYAVIDASGIPFTYGFAYVYKNFSETTFAIDTVHGHCGTSSALSFGYAAITNSTNAQDFVSGFFHPVTNNSLYALPNGNVAAYPGEYLGEAVEDTCDAIGGSVYTQRRDGASVDYYNGFTKLLLTSGSGTTQAQQFRIGAQSNFNSVGSIAIWKWGRRDYLATEPSVTISAENDYNSSIFRGINITHPDENQTLFSFTPGFVYYAVNLTTCNYTIYNGTSLAVVDNGTLNCSETNANGSLPAYGFYVLNVSGVFGSREYSANVSFWNLVLPTGLGGGGGGWLGLYFDNTTTTLNSTLNDTLWADVFYPDPDETIFDVIGDIIDNLPKLIEDLLGRLPDIPFLKWLNEWLKGCTFGIPNLLWALLGILAFLYHQSGKAPSRSGTAISVSLVFLGVILFFTYRQYLGSC
jgi:hypothetical protein